MQTRAETLTITEAHSGAQMKTQLQKRKLTSADVSEIELFYLLGYSMAKIAQEFPQVSYTSIRNKIKTLRIDPLEQSEIMALAQQYQDQQELLKRLRYESKKRYYENQLNEAKNALKAMAQHYDDLEVR